jgi:hypothetical protein
MANGAGAEVVHPFMDPKVVASVTRRFGFRGPRSRTAAMRLLFADLLPDGILARGTKSSFDEAFISTYSRDFATGWTGGGIHDDLVDRERLASEWQSPQPDPRSMLLMQATWLATHYSAAERGGPNAPG